MQAERDRLQQRADEQAAMLTQHGSQGKALEASSRAAQQEVARLQLDLQAAEHQHSQQLVSPSHGSGDFLFESGLPEATRCQFIGSAQLWQI